MYLNSLEESSVCALFLWLENSNCIAFFGHKVALKFIFWISFNRFVFLKKKIQ